MNGFCEKCRDTVKVKIEESINNKNIRGNHITYAEHLAYCEECNEEVFVSEIRDNNLRSLDNAFRRPT